MTADLERARSRRDVLRKLVAGGGVAALASACATEDDDPAYAIEIPGGRVPPDRVTLGDGSEGERSGTYLDVRDFGAIGDGIANDTAAIQAALDAAATSDFGAVVYLPRGIYLVNSALVIASRTRVIGDGIGITIVRGMNGTYLPKVVNGNPVFATLACVASTDSAIERITVDHATNSTRANGIVFVPDGENATGTVCTNCRVQDCEVRGFASHQYMIWNHRGRHIKILNNYVDGWVPVLDPTASSQEGIESFGGHDVLIQGNTVVRVGNAGINLGSAVGVPNTECVGIRVVNNYVEAARVGIHLGTSWDEVNGPQNLSHIRISANVVIRGWEHGIHLETPLPGTSLTDVQIIGNSIADARSGITLYGLPSEADHHGIVVSDNVITGSTGSSPTDLGAISAFYMANLFITNNVIVDSANAAIWLSSLQHTTIRDNQVDGAERYAIIAQSCSELFIKDNRFRDYNSAGGYPALLLVSATRTVVRGNTFAQMNDGQTIVVDASSDEVRLSDNALMHASGAPLPFGNEGSNPDSGAVTGVAGASEIDVMSTLVNDSCRIVVTQESGGIVGFRIARLAGGFRIHLAWPASGDETFRWAILQ